MPRVCTICASEKRSEIELSASNGLSYRAIARQYSVSHDAVQRHMAEHIKQAAKQLMEARKEALAIDVTKQLKAINECTLSVLTKAYKEGKPIVALAATDRVLRQLEFAVRLQSLDALEERLAQLEQTVAEKEDIYVPYGSRNRHLRPLN
jgi:IS30 family transposase